MAQGPNHRAYLSDRILVLEGLGEQSDDQGLDTGIGNGIGLRYQVKISCQEPWSSLSFNKENRLWLPCQIRLARNARIVMLRKILRPHQAQRSVRSLITDYWCGRGERQGWIWCFPSVGEMFLNRSTSGILNGSVLHHEGLSSALQSLSPLNASSNTPVFVTNKSCPHIYFKCLFWE